MIDTHAHIYLESYDQDREVVLAECRIKLNRVVNVGIDLPTSSESVAYAGKEDFLYAAVGFHPHEATRFELLGGNQGDALEKIDGLVASRSKVVAVGEIGLDYHPSDVVVDKTLQQRWFHAQINMALVRRLPIVIHSRDAFDDTLAVVSTYVKQDGLSGVWHSFTENSKRLQQIVDIGLFIGINGILTFPSARELRDAVAIMPRSQLVLETDAPFLAPQQHRGTRNSPVMVECVARTVADLWGISVDEVVRITDENAYNLFTRLR